MKRTSLWSLQQALYERLMSDNLLNKKITGVFDEVIEGTPYPYVTIGEPTVLPFETKTSFGEEVAIVLHCWSQYPGKKEAFEILNLILGAITKSPLVITGGFSLLKTELEQMTVIIDIDDVTRHGIIRLKFYINN
ncbi:DUF3168 domain-containing protein [Priestia flexa]|uniref:DUF3168 domain-containing protein n=1 Tax=Priestia flexa TaxID=86664 RepID=UPI001CFE87DD|nr:DUF3168 domain-containing protein [Priestia flexa]